MNHTINNETLEIAVKMKQGILVQDMESLNRFVGDAILQLAGTESLGAINVKSAIKKVAKDQFEKDTCGHCPITSAISLYTHSIFLTAQS